MPRLVTLLMIAVMWFAPQLSISAQRTARLSQSGQVPSERARETPAPQSENEERSELESSCLCTRRTLVQLRMTGSFLPIKCWTERPHSPNSSAYDRPRCALGEHAARNGCGTPLLC